MRILFVVFVSPYHGYGHFFRTQAVITEAERRGHTCYFASNVGTGPRFIIKSINDIIGMESALRATQPDWMVLDILEPHSHNIVEIVHEQGALLALLNGVGRHESLLGTDIAWAQDTPDKAILRREICELRRGDSDKTFVWGGAADELGLCRTYMQWMNDPAWIVTTDMATPLPQSTHSAHVKLSVKDNEIFLPMQNCRRAVLHLGMTCWEMARLGVPMYIFARSSHHLVDAQKFEELGYAKAYPKSGLPPNELEFKKFLSQTFTLSRTRPDGKGAERFLETLEK